MGNQNKKFSGQGHVLGNGEGNRTGASAANAGRYGNTSNSGKSQSGGGSFPAVRKSFKSKKRPVISEEQRAAQRAQQMAAAEKRGNAWNEKLQKHREKRFQETTEDSSIQFDDSKGTARSSANVPVDAKLKKKLESDAKALENAGFNPYEANFATSGNARAAIDMGRSEGSYENQTAEIEHTGNYPVNEGTVVENQVELGIVSSKLHDAIEKCDATLLKEAIELAENSLDNAQQDILILEIQRARELYSFLCPVKDAAVVTPETIKVVSSALQRLSDTNITSIDECAAALLTTKKVLENIKANPDDPKYRKIRLSNKAIQKKLVEPAAGEALNILRACGFVDTVECDDGENISYLILEDDYNKTIFAARASALIMYMEDTLESCK